MKKLSELGASLFTTIPVMINSIYEDGVKSVLKIKNESLVIRATRIGRVSSKRCEIYLTIGKPNFRERRLIKNFRDNGATMETISKQLYLKKEKSK